MENEDNKKSENEGQEKKEPPLFREEVLQAKKGSYFGRTLIVSPISFSAWAVSLFLVAFAIGLFVYFGEYSKRQEVAGMLVPDKGLITLYAKSSGTVSKKFIQHGEAVVSGQLLYLISTEQETLGGQGAMAQQIELLEKQIEAQKNKIKMFEKSSAGYEKLLKQHYISELEYQVRQQDYLNAKIALHDYEKSLSQTKGGADYAIRAPVDGIVSVSLVMEGDHVTADTALVSIIPQGSKLEGVLFVPTSKSGFAKVGQKVLLKYSAYPYQQFGLYESIIDRIDKSVLNPQDMAKLVPFKIDEPFYRVIVALEKQTVMVYGKPYPLTAGMVFQAVILGEKRRIWQWIFEPILSLKGALK